MMGLAAASLWSARSHTRIIALGNDGVLRAVRWRGHRRQRDGASDDESHGSKRERACSGVTCHQGRQRESRRGFRREREGFQKKRVRDFVMDHPSLTLVEFDIEAEAPRPESVMQAAFGIDEHCWAQSNCHSSCDEREESSRLRADDAAAGRDARAESRRLENLHAREVGSSLAGIL